MRYFNIFLVCGLLMVANGANAQSSLTDIDDIIQQGIKLQDLRDRQRRTDILQQQAETSRMNALTERVNTLIRNGDVESAEQILNNVPVNKAAGITIKIRPEQTVFEITKGNKTKIFSYKTRNPVRTMRVLPRAELGSQVDVNTGIAKNRAEVQTGGKPSAWFLISTGADKKWKINDTFEHLAECKKHRAVDPTNTVCVPSDMLVKSLMANPSSAP